MQQIYLNKMLFVFQEEGETVDKDDDISSNLSSSEGEVDDVSRKYLTLGIDSLDCPGGKCR